MQRKEAPKHFRAHVLTSPRPWRNIWAGVIATCSLQQRFTLTMPAWASGQGGCFAAPMASRASMSEALEVRMWFQCEA